MSSPVTQARTKVVPEMMAVLFMVCVLWCVVWSASEGLVEGGTGWVGDRRGGAERRVCDGAGEGVGAGPVGDVDVAVPGAGLDRPVQGRAVVAGLPAQVLAGGVPARDERVIIGGRDLERVDERHHGP